MGIKTQLTNSASLSQVLPVQIIKRDGVAVAFDRERVTVAILKAGRATNEFSGDEALLLSAQVLKILRHRSSTSHPTVEQVQDIVEQVLISANHFYTARAYIVYREKHKQFRKDQKTLVDVESSINEYLQQADWRVNANANQGYSVGGLILNTAGKVIANYWLSHIYPPEIGEAHRNADIHIHDLDMLGGYCAGWSLRTLLQQGFNGVPGRIDSGPAKHLDSALLQMVNFLGTLQNEWAGAQAFSSADTYLSPYIKKDALDYDRVKQLMQSFIFNLNFPSRWGSQAPFTNLTFDWVCPEDLQDDVPIIGDEEMPFTYGDCQKEMDMINRAYLEVMNEGDSKGRIFTFPIPTYNITEDFQWNSEN